MGTDPARVLLTRLVGRGRSAERRLREAGHRVDRLGILEARPVDPRREDRAAYEAATRADRWAFTSASAVAALDDATVARGAAAELAAVGPATARALERRFGRPAARVARSASGAALADELACVAARGETVAWFRGRVATDAFSRAMRRRGACVVELVVYEVLPTPALRSAANGLVRGAWDVWVVASAGSAGAVLDAMGDRAPAIVGAVAYGERTAEVLRRRARIDVRVSEAGSDGALVDAVGRLVGR